MAYIGSDISKFNTADELTVSGDANVTGTVKPAGDTAAGDDAAIGYTAAEGLILTGQGSTSDITLKNDADATVFTVPTGTDDILFPDSAKAMFGAGSDLQIYHDGSSSFIADVGTGNLTLLANEFRLNNSGNTENMITAAPDGAVTLFHNDSAKIATSSTGATITGATVTASGGSASAPAYAVTSGSLGANGLFVPAANTLGFSAAGTERMRVDSSGKLGIGTASPAHNLDVTQTGSTSARIGATGSSGDNDGTVIINNGGSGDAMLRFDYEGNTDRARIGVSSSAQQLEFYTDGNNERMRLSNLGNFHINNTTADSNAFNQGLIIYGNNQGGGVGGVIRGNNEHALVIGRSNSNGGIVLFRRDSSGVGSISVTTSATAYNTSSDYRLKTAVNYDWDATTRLKQLKPARFKWIVDGDDAVLVDGFLAHEAQAVVPESVTGTHNEVEIWKDGEELPDGVSVGDNKLDADGNTIPVYQGIDQSKLVPLLVKTIIELEARITALEAK